MGYLLGVLLSFGGAYGLWRNKKKFDKEIKKDGASFLIYLVDGLIFGTSGLYLLLIAIGFAFAVGLVKIQ